ncbi:hypothetical protein MGU_09814 [Metarhizium guizhouense ARSEF 977]|uniref:Uncharacterized protein n=1 Tax=Metarhizium guizhouense (strain ARSEF 977) TaxID=1276136 RepID=A0A0B4G833_METGA|nr:hypothetical protein MGU_09814 [Metarhizium guizhouense ARSEF 977]
MTPSASIALLKPAIQRMQAVAGSSTDILSAVIFRTTPYPSHRAFFKGSMAEGSSTAGNEHDLKSSARPSTVTRPCSGTIIAYDKRLLDRTGEAESSCHWLQGGPGPANVDPNMRGALLPAWWSTCVHAMSYSANFDTTVTPKKIPSKMATQRNKATEKV